MAKDKWGCVCGALLIAYVPVGVQPACAQSTATANPQQSATTDASSGATDIVVTGTRIARPEFVAPSPIVSLDRAAIDDSGKTNLTDFLLRVPALTGSRDNTQTSGGNASSAQPFGNVGLNLLNLRNLGVQRTLVLVNGRRHIAGTFDSAAVDVNAIPLDLIERVDVLTGSTSAIYGADGVSGVVNFVLKHDFEGITGRLQSGITTRGDDGTRFGSIAVGRNFGGGRGNIALAVEHAEEDRVANDDRDYLRQNQRQYLIPNLAKDTNPKAFSNILVGDLRYPNESPIGAVDVKGGGVADFNGLGLPYRHGAPASYYTTGASDDTPVAGFYSGDLAPQTNRTSINLLAHYDVSGAFKPFIEAKYVFLRATTFDYFNSIYGYSVPITNPTMPESIRAAVVAAGFGAATVYRDNLDYGRHGESDARQTWRAVVGARGQLTDHASYEVSYVNGRTDVRITKINEIVADRYYAALDVVTDPRSGALACRSSIDPTAATATGAVSFVPGPNSGCRPVSLFGGGPIDGQALAFFQGPDVSTARVTQQAATAFISGDFGAIVNLPGGAPQFSVGAEYRRETSMFAPSANFASGRILSYNLPQTVAATGGAYDVKEAFAELNLPILTDAPFAKTLSLGAAYRISSYSTVGRTQTWQLNGIYAPIEDVSLRGSYGQAVRAPNIGELFAPQTGTFGFVTDPCTPAEIGNGSRYRAANCSALLDGLGVPANARGTTDLQTGNFIFGSQSGNSALKAETARTWTAGVVVRPRFIPGLTLSVDWYDINLRDAITQVQPSDLVNLCVDAPSITNGYCAAVTRASGTGRVTGYQIQPENVAAFRTAGADLNIAYRLRTLRTGSFDLRLVGGYLHRLELVSLPGAAPIDNVDQFGSPRWNFVFSPTWSVGAITLAYNLRYFDNTRVVARVATDNDPLYAPDGQIRYRPLWQHDIQVALRAGQAFQFFGGITNLTDQKPDPGNSINSPISAIGRSLYVGVRLRDR